ncbi:34369_t:CDS:2, partial [Gigaspora margarita]
CWITEQQFESIVITAIKNSEDSEGSKIEATEYDPNIIEHFDVENIVFLRNEMFRDSESNADNEE